MPVLIRWHGDELLGRLDAGVKAGLAESGLVIVDSLRTVVGVPGNGTPSSPGEAPRRQSGRLHGSFAPAVVGNRLTVHSSAPYAAYLSDGTPDMAPRPFVQRALTLAAAANPAPAAPPRGAGFTDLARRLKSAFLGAFRRR